MEIGSYTLPQAVQLLSRRFNGRQWSDWRPAPGTREIYGAATVRIARPTARIAIVRGRRLNPWVTLAEFPWLLAGRNDVEWLLPYLPRAADFSDDGKTWRAGYGPRLRSYRSTMDQLVGLVEVLERDPTTRQAVITIWDPWVDLGSKSKDLPCTNWMHFLQRDEDLQLTVGMRSNDLIWGFSGVNVTNFTLLQELVAELMGWHPSTYFHVAGSMHIYERHYQRLGAMAESACPYTWGGLNPARMALGEAAGQGTKGLAQATRYARAALGWVTGVAGRPAVSPERVAADLGLERGNWFTEWAYFMHLYRCAEVMAGDADGAFWAARLHEVTAEDWRLAAGAFINRREGRGIVAATDIGLAPMMEEFMDSDIESTEPKEAV